MSNQMVMRHDLTFINAARNVCAADRFILSNCKTKQTLHQTIHNIMYKSLLRKHITMQTCITECTHKALAIHTSDDCRYLAEDWIHDCV